MNRRRLPATLPPRTAIGQHRPVPAAWRAACRAADDDPAAYPPARPSKLNIRGSVSL